MKKGMGLISALLLVLCTGCMPTMTNRGSFRAYSPEQAAGVQPALLKLGQDYGLSIVQVDRSPVGCRSLLLICPSEVDVLPGKHEVLLRFMNRLGQRADVCVWFVAKPGRDYLAKFKRTDRDSIFTWIEDGESKTPVGGICGSSDEPVS